MRHLIEVARTNIVAAHAAVVQCEATFALLSTMGALQTRRVAADPEVLAILEHVLARFDAMLTTADLIDQPTLDRRARVLRQYINDAIVKLRSDAGPSSADDLARTQQL